MSYGLGLRAIKRLCAEQKPMLWYQAKLTPSLFKANELPIYQMVDLHLKQFHVLPQMETLEGVFPDLTALQTPEPATFYLKQLEDRYCYDRLNKANLESQSLLKADPTAHEQATEILKACMRDLTEQKYRLRILDVVAEGPKLLLQNYHKTSQLDAIGAFGWPYMDQQSGGVMPGDVISFVGRPAVGKTWAVLWTAVHNWRIMKVNTLFVSMEMTILPIAQRIGALYTHLPIQQLKQAAFSTHTLKKFTQGLKGLLSETTKFWVMDGNLAANVEEIFALADLLQCPVVCIDGAYLLRHTNTRLDRFTRAAENVELIKRFCTDLNMLSFCSWQFNRQASQKQKKGGADKGDLEDIGYTDAIAQISSIALGLYQEESVETIKERKVHVMKGRNGEIGQFSIAWDFTAMDFSQTSPSLTTNLPKENTEFEWV